MMLREEAASEIEVGGDRVDGLVYYEVRFWETAKRKRDGVGDYDIDGRRCDLMNSFKMQIRENHQRVVSLPGDGQFPEGYTRHVSGLAIPNVVIADPMELRKFLEGKDLPLDGYAPFHFPNYDGIDELLNGMWQHVAYDVPLLGQVKANIERYIDVAKREQWEGDKRGTTVNLQVGAGADDAHEVNTTGDMVVTADNVHFTLGGTENHCGYRFTSVAIPKADTIDAATMQIYMTFAGDEVHQDFEADDVDDAPTFTTSNSNISNRTGTTATVNWDDASLGSTFNTSPEFKTIAQEIVNRGSWASGNDIAMLAIWDGVTEWNFGQQESYEADTAKAAKFDITHSAPGGGLSIPIAMHYYQQRRR